MTDKRTTAWGYVTAFAAFVSFAPELFPETELWGKAIQRIAAFIAIGGIAGGFNAAKDSGKGSDRPQEVADAKLDRVPPIDTPRQ